MGLKCVSTLITVILLSSCSARIISQSAISSVLQDIMSPANTDKAMQIINMAATRANKNIAIPNVQRTMVARNDCGLPARTFMANELPSLAIVSNEMQLPGRIIASEMGLPGVARIISSEQRFNPEILYPQRNMVRQIVREVSPANLIEFPREIYQTAPVALPQESIAYPCRTPAPAPNPYLPVAPPAPSPYLPFGPPNPYLPVAPPAPSPYLSFAPPNPYLPAASPMSAISPSYLPPPTQSKGQFLRKIPIPPPTL